MSYHWLYHGPSPKLLSFLSLLIQRISFRWFSRCANCNSLDVFSSLATSVINDLFSLVSQGLPHLISQGCDGLAIMRIAFKSRYVCDHPAHWVENKSYLIAKLMSLMPFTFGNTGSEWFV